MRGETRRRAGLRGGVDMGPATVIQNPALANPGPSPVWQNPVPSNPGPVAQSQNPATANR